jgi:transcriptional regulator with XRE-family HTH domain
MIEKLRLWKACLGDGDPVDLLVGGRLRALRLQRRLSRRELAAAIGARVEDIRQFEAGVQRIGAARLLSIADVLDINVGTLFESNDSDDGRVHPFASRSLH